MYIRYLTVDRSSINTNALLKIISSSKNGCCVIREPSLLRKPQLCGEVDLHLYAWAHGLNIGVLD